MLETRHTRVYCMRDTCMTVHGGSDLLHSWLLPCYSSCHRGESCTIAILSALRRVQLNDALAASNEPLPVRIPRKSDAFSLLLLIIDSGVQVRVLPDSYWLYEYCLGSSRVLFFAFTNNICLLIQLILANKQTYSSFWSIISLLSLHLCSYIRKTIAYSFLLFLWPRTQKLVMMIDNYELLLILKCVLTFFR